MDIFTSITANYLPKARILAQSIKNYHTDWTFHLLLSDKLSGKEPDLRKSLQDGIFDRVVMVDELDIQDIYGWIFKHTVVELCTAVKGPFLQQLIREGHNKIVYIDPDIVILNPLNDLETLLNEHSILLTPHLLNYTDDPQSIHDNEIAGTLRHGTFNLGFMAVNAAREEGIRFSEWWGKRLQDYCYADYDQGLFTDQKWCDLIPSYFEDFYVIRDPGYNVASWNLDCRQISFDGGGQLMVNSNHPLRFYHFTGYDSGAGINVIDRLTSTGNNAIVKELWGWYKKQLSAYGQDKWGKTDSYYNFFNNGQKITNEMRRVYRNSIDLQTLYKNPYEIHKHTGGFYAWWLKQYPIKSEDSSIRVNQGSEQNLTGSNQPPNKIDNLILRQAETYIQLLKYENNEYTEDYVPLSSESLINIDLPVKAIAFYLPQFHPIAENDVWWGKGFTEWANVTRAVPQFPGHYQPHLPGELGFYDLRLKEVQYRQIELAKQYGLKGFAFYYYWFGGKRLLEYPIEQFFKDKDKDFSFCLCWANENWTRRWDGMENDILMQQVHNPETDIKFIKDLEPYLRDDRYIRIKDRPIIIVYRASLLPEPENTVNRWREYCSKHKLGNPYLIAAQTFSFEDPRMVNFDAAIEFPPHNQVFNTRFQINPLVGVSNPKYDSYIFSYPDVVKYKVFEEADPPYNLFKTVFPAWDNEPRKPSRGTVFANSSPEFYKQWLQGSCRWTLKNKPPEERLVFINAWNEWAEGAHLEPDRKYGYAYLQATMDTLKSL
ncbi:MAG: glycoside hydrolase family 99-like domain-containing protein [Calditrichaceae bacterium]|nr:glycoside hydrolase family 99-like domain-containing protein [Calditrichaceae bacterium]RQV93710.1 MAG: hypothetical protein EH224_11865 [Calditrichota bacterium]